MGGGAPPRCQCRGSSSSSRREGLRRHTRQVALTRSGGGSDTVAPASRPWAGQCASCQPSPPSRADTPAPPPAHKSCECLEMMHHVPCAWQTFSCTKNFPYIKLKNAWKSHYENPVSVPLDAGLLLRVMSLRGLVF